MGFRIWLILKWVTPVVSLSLSLCRWSWNFGGVLFVLFFGRRMSKNSVLLTLKEWWEKRHLSGDWFGALIRRETGNRKWGSCFHREFERPWAQARGGRPVLCLITEGTASTPKHCWGSGWAPTDVVVGFGRKKFFARTWAYSRRVGKAGDLTQKKVAAKGI